MAGKFFSKLVSGLTKTRNNIVSGLNSIFTGFSHIDEDFYEELEEILIMSDIGVNTTEESLPTQIAAVPVPASQDWSKNPAGLPYKEKENCHSLPSLLLLFDSSD